MPGDTDSNDDNTTEETAILRLDTNCRSHYHANNNVELGEIASLYLNKVGHIIFFSSLCIYLYGDLSIYAAASGKTIVNLFCDSNNNTEEYGTKCWNNYEISKMTMYRIFVTIFAVFVGPFTYFNVQKTKYLQFFTIVIRWLAFIIMVTLATVKLVKYGQQGHPKLINLSEVPALAGSSVYSFMCHHSIPGLIAPISDKRIIMKKVGFDFFLIVSFYLLLALTGSFAFQSLEDLYSLNFINAEDSSIFGRIIGYFLGAFPLFPMSTSFPIIAITLQNNLRNLFLDRSVNSHNVFVKRLVFPTIAILPPFVVALCTHNIKYLVEITGTYAGVIVQYLIPVILVFYARKQCFQDFGSSCHKYTSPFRHCAWLMFVIIWSIICIIFVTVDIIVNR